MVARRALAGVRLRPWCKEEVAALRDARRRRRGDSADRPAERCVWSGGVAWSPDSTRLAFVARVGGWQEPEREEDRGKSRPAHVISTLKYRFEGVGFTHDRRPHIFVVPVAGGLPKQITDGDFPDMWPTWSPDGARIAFVAERHETRRLTEVKSSARVKDAHIPDVAVQAHVLRQSGLELAGTEVMH